MHIRKISQIGVAVAADTATDSMGWLGIVIGIILAGGVIGTLYQYFSATGVSLKSE